MLKQRIKEYLKKLVMQERSPHKLALSFCVAIYIAFSPFILMHTPLVFIFSWLMKLNLPMTFAVAHLVHNPWAIVPIYCSGYLVGDWLMHSALQFNSHSLNPSWMGLINGYLSKYLGMSDISLAAFLVGCNVLGLILGLTLYPIMKYIFTKYLQKPSSLV